MTCAVSARPTPVPRASGSVEACARSMLPAARVGRAAAGRAAVCPTMRPSRSATNSSYLSATASSRHSASSSSRLCSGSSEKLGTTASRCSARGRAGRSRRSRRACRAGSRRLPSNGSSGPVGLAQREHRRGAEARAGTRRRRAPCRGRERRATCFVCPSSNQRCRGDRVDVAHPLAVALDRLARDPDAHPGDAGARGAVTPNRYALAREHPRSVFLAPFPLDLGAEVDVLRKQRLGLAMARVTGRQQGRGVVQMRIGKGDDLEACHAT